jgi:primase-polymerase (primpol)-like protein
VDAMTNNTIQKVISNSKDKGLETVASEVDLYSIGVKGKVLDGKEYLVPIFENFPSELTNLSNWLIWKGEKIPYRPNAPASLASVTEPSMWGKFIDARNAYEKSCANGVSFVLDGQGLGGIDIDKCVVNGKPNPMAMQLLNRLNASYIEYSPSGTGLHAFGYLENLKSGRRGNYNGLKVEFYTNERQLTVTGHTIKSKPFTRLKNVKKILAGIDNPTEDTKGTKILNAILLSPQLLLFLL